MDKHDKTRKRLTKQTGAWCIVVLSLLMAAFLTSCGDDEPANGVVDYYIEVEEQFLVNGSTDGTSRYDNPINLMKDAITKAYPEKTEKGNDKAVIDACDKAYEDYVKLYEGDLRDENLTALIHLKRAVRRGGIIKESETLKSYQFNINSHEPE